MAPMRFNTNGIHIIELIGCGVTDLLPGLLPIDGCEGEAEDDWEEQLVADFPHLGEN